MGQKSQPMDKIPIPNQDPEIESLFKTLVSKEDTPPPRENKRVGTPLP